MSTVILPVSLPMLLKFTASLLTAALCISAHVSTGPEALLFSFFPMPRVCVLQCTLNRTLVHCPYVSEWYHISSAIKLPQRHLTSLPVNYTHKYTSELCGEMPECKNYIHAKYQIQTAYHISLPLTTQIWKSFSAREAANYCSLSVTAKRVRAHFARTLPGNRSNYFERRRQTERTVLILCASCCCEQTASNAMKDSEGNQKDHAMEKRGCYSPFPNVTLL